MAARPLDKKTALITGAAGGLGKAIAAAFLQAGANVVVCDINKSMLDECATQLSSLGPLLAIPADITSEESVGALLKAAVDRFGQANILVNNAGIMDRFDPPGECDKGVWDRVLAVNLTGPFVLSKLAIKEFLRDGREGGKGGSILNVGSIAGLRGGSAGAAYTVSKHGLMGLTKNITAHYATQSIRCNIIMPGEMQTNIASAFVNGFNMEGQQLVSKLMEVNPGPVNTEELAKLAVFLSSDDAKYINGAGITADNGWSAI